MDGCNVLPETQFVWIHLREDTTRVLYMGGSLPPWETAGERSEFNIKPSLGAPLLIFPRGYLLQSFPQVDTCGKDLDTWILFIQQLFNKSWLSSSVPQSWRVADIRQCMLQIPTKTRFATLWPRRPREDATSHSLGVLAIMESGATS